MPAKPSKKICLYLSLILLLISTPVFATHRITMAFWEDPSQSPVWRWAELVYTAAFQRLDLEFSYEVYPPIRASLVANDGIVDGEPSRVRTYGDSHPNLIRVEVAVVDGKIVAYATKRGIELNGWESLRGKNYVIDYYRGIKLVQINLEKVVSPDRLFSISSEKQGLKKLAAGRTDLYVDSILRVSSLLKSDEFKDSGIYAAGVLMDMGGYPYLHKRHAQLVPKLAEVLNQMKQEGLLTKYKQQAREEFLKKRAEIQTSP